MEKEPNEKNRDRSPFVELEESDLKGPNSDFYQLPDRPEMVIRRSGLPVMEKYRENFGYKEAAEYWAELGRQFKHIGEKYGLRIPKTEYVIGHDPNSEQPALYTVSSRIEGENLDKIFSFTAEEKEKAGRELDEMYAGIFDHLRDSYRENGYFWSDFRNEQIMYGRIPGDVEKHFYISDNEPDINRWEDFGKAEKKEYIFWEQILMTFRAMKSSEMKFGKKPLLFGKARSSFERIRKEFSEPKDKRSREMRFAVLMEH